MNKKTQDDQAKNKVQGNLVHINPASPSTFASGVHFEMSEGMLTMIFHHKIKDISLDQGRIVITEQLARKCIDVLTKITNYYPSAPKEEKVPK